MKDASAPPPKAGAEVAVNGLNECKGLNPFFRYPLVFLTNEEGEQWVKNTHAWLSEFGPVRYAPANLLKEAGELDVEAIRNLSKSKPWLRRVFTLVEKRTEAVNRWSESDE